MSDEPWSWSEGNRLVEQLGSERRLGERVQLERKARGWSQAELARQMASMRPFPLPLHQSAISKIEPPDPDQTAGRPRSSENQVRRNVTIEEAIGFARVFEIPLGELLLPHDAVQHAAAWRSFNEAADYLNVATNARFNYDTKLIGLRKDAKISREFRERLRTYRAEVMDKIEAELRGFFDRDNQVRELQGKKPARWAGRSYVEANRPPAVVAIDDVLEGVDE